MGRGKHISVASCRLQAPDGGGEGMVVVLNLKPGCVVIELPKKANYPLFLYLFLQYGSILTD